MSNAKNNFTAFFSPTDFSKVFESYNPSPVDMRSFLETPRKNLQAISEAQQSTIEGIQAVAQHQIEFFSQLLEDNSTIARQTLSEGTPEEKIAQNADIFKNAYERTVDSMQGLSELVTSTSKQTTGILNKRVSASVNELKSAIKKPKNKAA